AKSSRNSPPRRKTSHAFTRGGRNWKVSRPAMSKLSDLFTFIMKSCPLRTSVIGSYPFPGWLEFACEHLDRFGAADRAELQDDAVIAALHDQIAAGLDVITDGEQTRLDFNLSFYGFLEGIELETEPPRRFGPPAHDQRGKHTVLGELRAPRGLGVVEEFQRLKRLAPPGPALKASVPGPYTLSGRLLPNERYKDRWA